jgi:DNA helicase II / ATP-dependent DNA helicase PcrA
MTTQTTFRPSPQQQTIFDFVSDRLGSAIVEAVAGAGKTTTLVQAVMRMAGSVAFAAYNKKIAVEIGEKLKLAGAGPLVKSGTFHSFGFAAVRRAFPNVKVDDKKLATLALSLRLPEQFVAFATKATSLAKQRAIGVLVPASDRRAWWDLVTHFELDEALAEVSPSGLADDELIEEAITWAQKLLDASVAADKDVIDFDDMIYAPLVHHMKMWQNDWVLIDEAQDTNPARRALAKKMLKAGGRVLAVGDSRQAIYGFTGADADSMELIEREFGCVKLPLTVTYRCPQAIVRHAHNWVSHIEAHPSAPEGQLLVQNETDFLTLPATSFSATDAVLCRNTKPLVELAYHFIRKGVPCYVEGREIGRGLIALAKRWKVTSLTTLRSRLEEYVERETAKYMAKGQETKAEALNDRVETLFVIMATLPAEARVADLQAKVAALFDDTQDGHAQRRLVLSTVHKAKGREWDRVFLYGRNKYMPSKFARQDWQLLQEDNLCYVAVTRAKQTLVEVLAAPKAER